MESNLRICKTRKTIGALALALFLCLPCAQLLTAQVTSGTIFGRVKDTSGAYIAGATVSVKSPQTGAQRVVTTNDSGDFVVPNMPPDIYTVTVEAKGFKKLETKGVVLSAADKLNAGEFELSIGTESDSVTVTADAGQLQLQSNSGERSDVVTSRQLNDVALNGRNVLDYLKLVPGVSGMVDGHVSGTGGLDSVNINGTRSTIRHKRLAYTLASTDFRSCGLTSTVGRVGWYLGIERAFVSC